MRILLLIIALLPSIMMIAFGIRYIHRPPANMNGASGYRTKRSRSSRENWEYAHKVCGKIWIIEGCISAVITLLILLIFISKSVRIFTILALILMCLDATLMSLIFIPVEKKLKEKIGE